MPRPRSVVPLRRFFAGRPAARELYRLADAAAGGERRATRSQIAFVDGRAFAWAWCPDRWLKGDVAPLVLSVALGRRDRSTRWKQVVRPAPGLWLHHVELYAPDDVDAFVRARLREARRLAARKPRQNSGRKPRA